MAFEVGRSAGFFLRHEVTKLRKVSDHSKLVFNDGDSFWAIWYKALIAFKLKYGGLRSANSIQVIPNDHTSTLPSYWPSSIASMTSGAIQYGVPTNEFAGEHIDAEPKSANLTVPFSVSKIFPAFTSRWMRLWKCKYSRPFKLSWHIADISSSFNGFLWTVRKMKRKQIEILLFLKTNRENMNGDSITNAQS